MKSQSINVLGYTGNNSQFVVQTANSKFSLNKFEIGTEELNPFEFILAGFAGYLNKLGYAVAKEQGMYLRSLQVEITADITLPDPKKLAMERPDISRIIINLKPSTPASVTSLKEWHNEVRRRSSLYNDILDNSALNAVLFKDYLLN